MVRGRGGPRQSPGRRESRFRSHDGSAPAEVQKLFKRTVPVGIEHGTVAVLDANNQPHEVTTFRKDIQTDGRHAVVEFGVSLMDDLARRDFTINAIAYHPIRHEWRDPFQGEQDLEKKLIRPSAIQLAVSGRLSADSAGPALQRAVRISHPPPDARSGEGEHSRSRAVVRERVRDEWFKGIQTAKKLSKLVALWVDTGAKRICCRSSGMRPVSIGCPAIPSSSQPTSARIPPRCSHGSMRESRHRAWPGDRQMARALS